MKTRSKLLAVAIASLATANAYADCTARNFHNSENEVVDAYIAYYGRVPDAGGLAYWTDQIEQQKGSLKSIIDAFGNSAEYTENFGELSNTDLVNNLYLQAFGRNAEKAGLDYYVGELEAGNMNIQSIALDIINGATGMDARVLANRARVARHYVTEVEATSYEIDINDMKSVMSEVEKTTSSADSACSDYDALIAEAAQDTTGLACDNGSKQNQPVKRVGQLTGVYGLSYHSEARASLGGIKKAVTGETSPTGKFEYYETCGEPAIITFCSGIKKNCTLSEQATGIAPVLPVGSGVIGHFNSQNILTNTNGITMEGVIGETYSGNSKATRDEILTNVYQLLIGLDTDGYQTNGVQLDHETRSRMNDVADFLDFALPGFDTDPVVTDLVTFGGREFLPGPRRAEIFRNVTEFQNKEIEPFDPDSVDNYLVLVPNAPMQEGYNFIGVKYGSFNGPVNVVTRRDVITEWEFRISRLLSNYYDEEGNITESKVSLTNAKFKQSYSTPSAISADAETHTLANRSGDPGKLKEIGRNTDDYDTTWKYYINDDGQWVLDLYAFRADRTPASQFEPAERGEDFSWKFTRLLESHSAFPNANALMAVYDGDGVLKSKHLVELTSRIPFPGSSW
ncbi:MAG: hypothetical protein CSA52_00285 [Gammaproteobacteria bacterium]|nr:MAG: hypothetical protein CSB48_02100 [Pseudomonadota bacterium]PIE39017.1 MAG: hypothetical protein CSA52_00285 [Gammaproteobacteria bacterium]